MSERCDFPKNLSSEEELHWALIWEVAPQMEGTRPSEPGDSEIIGQIGNLRRNGKLTEAQLKVLDAIGGNAAMDLD
jgi:hypothetical protein